MTNPTDAEINAILAEAGLLIPKAQMSRVDPVTLSILDDREVLDLAFRTKNGDAIRRLYDGNTSTYNNDESSADFALAGYLAFWCGPNPQQIERLMRSSKLARPKWDERRPGGTYLSFTIEKILKNQTEFYAPTAKPPAQNGVAPAQWRFLSLSELADSGVSQVEWVIEGILARRYTTLMPGVWKSGKSTLEAHYIRALGNGGTFCGLEATPGRVTVVSEEPGPLWIKRCDAVKMDPHADHVDFLCRPFPMGRPSMHQWMSLITAVAEHVKGTNRSLVVFDSIHNLWGLENENDNAEQLRWLAPLSTVTEAGAALLLTGHPSKADQAEGKATRGGGAIAGVVDIITEFRRYDPADTGNRLRVLTGFSRFEETPAELVLELTAGGEYRAVGTKAEVRVSLRMDEILAVLPPAPPGKSAKEIHDEWAGERTPTKRTIENDLSALFKKGLVNRTGAGTSKIDPFRWHKR